jgi:hypothetical protein
MTPLRAALPECSGLLMVPKLTLIPLASDALMPITFGICATGVLRSRALAAAAAMAPTMPVVCQPPTLEARKFVRATRAATSQPMMKAATISAGLAPVVSASGSAAGSTALAAWPAT